MVAAAAPGVSAREIDTFGRELIECTGGRPAPELTYGFPGATCISINAVVAHGVPGDVRLREGDLVNIDVSIELDGYFADTGESFVVGSAAPSQARLLAAARAARDEGVAALRAGRLLNVIGRAVERVAAQRGYRIVRNLASHGVGRGLHEAPESIPTWFEPRDRRRLHEGLVMTVEPFLATHVDRVHEDADGWSLRCRRGHAAQFEHSVVVTSGAPIILT